MSREFAEPVGAVIELSPAQVEEVISAASGDGDPAVVASDLGALRRALELSLRTRHPRFSSSLLQGLMMLCVLPPDGTYIRNTELARVLEISPSTAHRYVSTLAAVGLVEHDPVTHKYRLAP